MRQKLTKAEVKKIASLAEKVNKLYIHYYEEENDVELNYGNVSVSEQLGCAVAGLDCILQEYL